MNTLTVASIFADLDRIEAAGIQHQSHTASVGIDNISNAITVYALDPDVYPETGKIGDRIRVEHTNGFAYLTCVPGDDEPWASVVESIIDFLTTETPVPA